jgi:NTP pyrophosphatase (non-canonical NTP hydrolase)
MGDKYVPRPIKIPNGTDFLSFLQEESQRWREHSFPAEHRTPELQVLGVSEECGELAHAVLKMKQGIRGTDEDHLFEAADAVGDIVIYLAGVCSSLGLDLHACVSAAWWQVASRDWSVNKQDGRDESVAQATERSEAQPIKPVRRVRDDPQA